MHSVVREHVGDVRGRNPALLRQRRRAGVAPGRQVGGDARGHPRRAVGSAAHHDGVGTGGCECGLGAAGVDDVAVDDDGNAHCLLHAAHEGPVGDALEELAARAGVDGDQRHAGILGAAGELGRVAARVVPAQPHLERHRYAHGADHGLDQAQGVREVAHQGRARLLAGHLAGRAAHVDVDDVGAQISRHARPFCHPARLAARQLYDERSKIPANRAFAGVVAVVDQVLARHHFGGNEAGAQNMGDPSERKVCHARHGREQHIALEGVRPNADLAALPFPRGRAYAIAHLLGIFSCCTCLGHSISWPHAPQARKPRYPKIIRVAGRRSGG